MTNIVPITKKFRRFCLRRPPIIQVTTFPLARTVAVALDEQSAATGDGARLAIVARSVWGLSAGKRALSVGCSLFSDLPRRRRKRRRRRLSPPYNPGNHISIVAGMTRFEGRRRPGRPLTMNPICGGKNKNLR
jgi:hypothetical protein